MANDIVRNTDKVLEIASKSKEIEFEKRLYTTKPYTLDIYIATPDDRASIYLNSSAVAALREWLNRGV